MTPIKWAKQLAAVSLCVLGACAAGGASAETLTFDNIGAGGPYPASYTELGFVVTSLSPDGGHLHAGEDNLYLHSREGSSPYQIRRVDGANFNLLSFDYFGGDSTFVTDTGAVFTILGEQPLVNFALSAAFQNINYVNWYMTNPGTEGPFGEQWGNIDNVVLSAVPEPASLAMLGVGLFGVLLTARSRRNQRGK